MVRSIWYNIGTKKERKTTMKLGELIKKVNFGDILYVDFTVDGEFHSYESHDPDLEKYLNYDVEEFTVYYRYDNLEYDDWGYVVTLICHELA